MSSSVTLEAWRIPGELLVFQLCWSLKNLIEGISTGNNHWKNSATRVRVEVQELFSFQALVFGYVRRHWRHFEWVFSLRLRQSRRFTAGMLTGQRDLNNPSLRFLFPRWFQVVSSWQFKIPITRPYVHAQLFYICEGNKGLMSGSIDRKFFLFKEPPMLLMSYNVFIPKGLLSR